MTSGRSFRDAYLLLLTEALGDLTDGWAETAERTRLKLVHEVLRDIDEFPELLFESSDLPVHNPSPQWSYSVFPLGEHRYTWLEEHRGRTTLYIGSDRSLYEYGPLDTSPGYPFIGNNPIELRRVVVNDLDIGELLSCRDLLRRVWLV